jgi:broad specificity phosphatase PhoE
MNKPALLILLRHGESERNVVKKNNSYFPDNESRKLDQGIPDHKIDLTAEGIRQSRVTGEALRAKFGTFDYIYDSGYQRTVHTATEMLKAWPEEERARIKVRQNLLIRERDPGYAYDMTTAEAEAAFPWLSEYWQTFGDFFAYPPGGESLAKATERVSTFLHTIYHERAGQKVVIVAHEWVLRSMLFVLERWDYEEVITKFLENDIDNCGVIIYGWNEERKTLVQTEPHHVYWQAAQPEQGLDN